MYLLFSWTAMKRHFRSYNIIFQKVSIIAFCISFFLFAGGTVSGGTSSIRKSQQGNSVHFGKKILTAAGVYLRKAPSLNAKRIVMTHFGDIVFLIGISPQNEEWFQVETRGQISGWINGKFLADFNEKDELQLCYKISKHKIDTSQNFGDIIDVSNFLERNINKSIGTSYENTFKSLYMISLRKSLSLIPKDKYTEPPYNEWIYKHNKEPYWKTIYQSPSEPDGVDRNKQVHLPSQEKNIQFSESLSIEDLLEMFIQFFDSNDPTLKSYSDQAWEKVISKGAKVIPELVDLIQDSNQKHYLQAIACSAIGEIGKVHENDVSKGYFIFGAGSPAKEAIPHMIKLLNDPGFSEYQQLIISALGQIGNDAEAAVPHIIKRLNHEEKQVVMVSIIALGKISTNEKISLPALSEIVKNDDREMAVEATHSIAKFGQLSRIILSNTEFDVVNVTLKAVATALLDALNSNYIEVQRVSSYYLAGIAHQSENPKPVLIRALQSDDAEVRYYIAQTIKQLVIHDPSYASILIKSLEKEQNKQVRRMLMDAIKVYSEQ